MYEGKKVYGPYIRKDGRYVVILKTPGSTSDHKTISYPKYLVECALGRYLNSNETVDHIDGNFSNNDLSNLRVIDRAEHCRSHTLQKQRITSKCVICGNTFTTTDASRITCGSKSCRGSCAHIDGYNKGNSFSRNNTKVYKDMRHTVDYIKSVREEL